MKTTPELIQAIAEAEAALQAAEAAFEEQLFGECSDAIEPVGELDWYAERLAALKTELAQRKVAQTQTEQPAMFDLEPAATQATCKTCKHIERKECNSKAFFYCGVRACNRTENGMLKIKANMPACPKYKPKP